MSDLTDALRAGVPYRKERWSGNDGKDMIQDVYGASLIMKEAADKIDQLSSLIEDLKNSEHQKRTAILEAWADAHNGIVSAVGELAGGDVTLPVVKHWYEKTLENALNRAGARFDQAKNL